MKLISMTDFVIETLEKEVTVDYGASEKIMEVFRYANFLKQPLKLEMFIPCDDDGNVLEEPDSIGVGNDFYYERAFDQYQKAKEKVLFEGFEFKKTRAIHLYELFINDKFMFTYNSSTNAFLIVGSTIEHLVKYNLETI